MVIIELNSRVRKKLDVLKRRATFLKNRIKNKNKNELSFDFAELGALEWVITLIEDGVDTLEYQKMYEQYLREKEVEASKK